ncbi:stage III sporulation protein SpoIIIAB [Virgibacillus sediminis]|uniref:Stage III sporulation protein SpoIIIAB n=1 Tax=Virgibacillus sediminis TaxID=202260 RepID=A0ABV7A5A8_9BACI
MKWIGALLFIAATTWVGLEWSNRLSSRPRHIRQLKNALQILEAEMLYSQLSLEQAFRNISRQVPLPISSFFDGMSQEMQGELNDFIRVWEKHVKQLVRRSCLSSNEEEILLQFGRTLGQHDFRQQQKHIQLTGSHLQRELEEARDLQWRYSKMAKSLGLLGGLFIVLLLL